MRAGSGERGVCGAKRPGDNDQNFPARELRPARAVHGVHRLYTRSKDVAVRGPRRVPGVYRYYLCVAVFLFAMRLKWSEAPSGLHHSSCRPFLAVALTTVALFSSVRLHRLQGYPPILYGYAMHFVRALGLKKRLALNMFCSAYWHLSDAAGCCARIDFRCSWPRRMGLTNLGNVSQTSSSLRSTRRSRT